MKRNDKIFLFSLIWCMVFVFSFMYMDITTDEPPRLSVYMTWSIFAVLILTIVALFLVALERDDLRKQVLREGNT